jgi:hypothetical protein
MTPGRGQASFGTDQEKGVEMLASHQHDKGYPRDVTASGPYQQTGVVRSQTTSSPWVGLVFFEGKEWNMPVITIQISELHQAQVMDHIDKRHSFQIDGGRVIDSDGKPVFLESIEFKFLDSDRHKRLEAMIDVHSALKGST